MDWLERRANTECPCCRVSMVSDEAVWKMVKRLRRERQRKLRLENGIVYRFVQWMFNKKRSDVAARQSEEVEFTENTGDVTNPTGSDIEEGATTDENSERNVSSVEPNTDSDTETDDSTEIPNSPNASENEILEESTNEADSNPELEGLTQAESQL